MCRCYLFYFHSILLRHDTVCQPLTGILKFECCSCNQYAPDEDLDSRNVEIINQQSYIGVGLLIITFLHFMHICAFYCMFSEYLAYGCTSLAPIPVGILKHKITAL